MSKARGWAGRPAERVGWMGRTSPAAPGECRGVRQRPVLSDLTPHVSYPAACCLP